MPLARLFTSDLQGRSRIYLVIIYVSQFGIVAADRSGFGANTDYIVLNHFMRLIACIGISLFFLADILVSRKIKKAYSGSLSLIILLYLFFFLIYPFTLSYAGNGRYFIIGFRCYEWVVIIVLIINAFPMSNCSGNYTDHFINFSKLIIRVTISIVVFYAFLFPDAMFSITDERFRLGGSAIQPNRLALVCAFGILLFGLYGKNISDLGHIAVCVFIAILTDSRMGLLLILISVYSVLLYRVNLYIRLFANTSALAITIILVMFVAQWVSEQSIQNYVENSNILTLNSRTVVWETAIIMFWEQPFIGWGFIDGPELIGSFSTQNWWNATNAQNDILNTLVSGGLIATMILFYLYYRIWSVFFSKRGKQEKFFFMTVFCLYLLSSFFEPLLVHHLVQPAILFVIFIRFGSSSQLRKSITD